MRAGKIAVIGLALALVVALSAPVRAGATDSDLKHAFAFKVEASNGYSILAFAANERADGHGQIALIVNGKGGTATYSAPAVLTATSVKADLGPLGRVSLDVVPSGRKKKLRSRCADEPETFAYEPQLYRGVFEFHGEEGYADATTAAPREYSLFFLDLLCTGGGSGETGGATLPGARLRLRSHRGDFRLALQANKNRPDKRSRFEAEVHEKRGAVSISRSTSLWVGAAAFRYDPLLATATLEPPAPFSGRASFHRGAAQGDRWTGDLTVDLPGRSNVPLTGPGVGATLIHSCWHEGEGRFRC
jgi:hypothetical protein